MGLDFRQTLEFERNIRQANRDLPNMLKKFLLKEGQRIIAQTKQNTPVDTGALRAAWLLGNEETRVFTNEEGRQQSDIVRNADIESVRVVGDDLQITIVNNMEYASYVEYGTSKMEGRYMLTRSIAEVERNMPNRLKREFRRFLRGYGIE